MRVFHIWLLLILGIYNSCQKKEQQMKLIDKSNFTKLINKKQVSLFTLKNKKGMTTQITNYGGRVVNLWVSNKDDDFENIVLGYDDIDSYLNNDEAYFGALIGRYGNRINEGQFVLNNRIYNLNKNNYPNHMHGGEKGFYNVVWDVVQISDTKLQLNYISQDGEEGYPGNLNVTVIYTLTDDNELKISYTANTNKTTIVNLTNHSYFNLQGVNNGLIDNHILQIKASKYTPVNKEMIPTGEITSVKNTPFDFILPTKIGERVNEENEQLKFGSGYDHNYVLDAHSELKLAAIAKELKSGRIMEVYTNEPGIQFYSGNHLNNKRTAFCLETQHFPNSPNQQNFPSTILNPNDTFRSICIYKFSLVN